MKINFKILQCLLLIFVSLPVIATDRLTYGFGIGSSYSGLGFNTGVISASDFKYVSAGVLGYSSSLGSVYGIGAGWMRANLFESITPNHGVNVHVGISKFDREDSHKSYFRAGYLYLFDGIRNPGKTIGFSFLHENDIDGASAGLSLQFSYGSQF